MTDSVLMSSDLSDLCRVCLQMPEESQYLDLSTIYDEDDHLTYSDCFMICTQIDLKAGIGVPHHLCKPCGLELQMSYDFHKKIEESKRVIAKYEKHMQATASEQEFLPQNAVKIEQDKDPDEEQLNDDIQYPQSSKVVKETHCPQTQKVHKVTQNEQEYLLDSDDENSVELLSKIGSMKNDDNDEVAENEHAVSMDECIEIEEHLEMDDFQNLETLEEEDLKTFIIKAERPENQDEEEMIIPDDTDMLSNMKSENEFVCDREIKIEQETLQDSGTFMNSLKPAEKLPTMPTNGPPFLCNICGLSLRTINSLHEHHILKHSPVANQYDRLYVCNHCGHSIPSSKMIKRNQRLRKFRDKTEIWTCDRCTLGWFELEKRCEMSAKPNTCEYCLIEFKNIATYREHVIDVHNVNPFQCNLCTRTFKSNSSLKIHKQTKHENKRYICEHQHCGKMYSTLDALRQHNYKHMNTMPYRCDICHKMCSREGILRRHLQRDHDIQPSQQDLDDMLVGKLVNINAELKTVNKFKKRHAH